MSSKEPYGSVGYADPGYQTDGKKRYPIDTAEHVRAAWSYIHVASNARLYTPAQVAQIKSRIAQAATKFGIDLQAEKASWLSALLSRYAGPSEAAKRKRGKHRYVPTTSGLFGPARCAVCGQPPNDPDHDNDVDPPGQPDVDAPQQAVGDNLPDPEDAAIKQTHDAGYDAETQVIAENKKHANAGKKHPFRAGEFPKRDGSSRCLMCGGAQPTGGMCNTDAPPVTDSAGSSVIPVAASDDTDAAKIAAGIDAAVDQALTLLRSCNNDDLLPYAQQARDLLQGIEPACDVLLAYFDVPDPDDAADAQKAVDYGQASIVVLGDDWAVVDGGGTVLGRYESFEAAQAPLQAARLHLPLPVDPEAVEGEEPEDILGGDPDDELPKSPIRAYAQPVALWPENTYTVTDITTPDLSTVKAFVEEINGKTIITTRAATTELAGAMTNHQHYLWTQGKLVGADEANRNGAYWSSGDLELGQTTVPYGPFNWLHEEKHVIGTIAAASYSQADVKAALATVPPQNHIAIAAPVWRWLYPDEAAVIEMASETGKFWYSMECISKNVACVGDAGCGAEVSYFDYMQGQNGTCEHMVQKSGVRRFIEPTFLGAAAIVPPVRPGWAGADASVMKQAAAFAGEAFEAAGRPDMTAAEWDLLMAQVVRFATS